MLELLAYLLPFSLASWEGGLTACSAASLATFCAISWRFTGSTYEASDGMVTPASNALLVLAWEVIRGKVIDLEHGSAGVGLWGHSLNCDWEHGLLALAWETVSESVIGSVVPLVWDWSGRAIGSVAPPS